MRDEVFRSRAITHSVALSMNPFSLKHNVLAYLELKMCLKHILLLCECVKVCMKPVLISAEMVTVWLSLSVNEQTVYVSVD